MMAETEGNGAKLAGPFAVQGCRRSDASGRNRWSQSETVRWTARTAWRKPLELLPELDFLLRGRNRRG